MNDLLNILEKEKIDDFKVFYCKDNNNKTFKITSPNAKENFLKLIVLNNFFEKMFNEWKDKIKEGIDKIQDILEVEEDEKFDSCYLTEFLEKLFIEFLKTNKDNFLKEIEKAKKIEKLNFKIKENNNPFGIQIDKENEKYKYFFVVYAIDKNFFIKNRKKIIEQIKGVITKDIKDFGSIEKSILIFIKIDYATIKVIKINDFGKNIIKKGGGILFVMKKVKNEDEFMLQKAYEIIK